MIEIQFQFIAGMSLGIELVEYNEDGDQGLLVNLFIVKFLVMFH